MMIQQFFWGRVQLNLWRASMCFFYGKPHRGRKLLESLYLCCFLGGMMDVRVFR